MSAPVDLGRFRKLCGLLSSDHTGEAAAAAGKATEWLRLRGLSWADVAVGPKPVSPKAEPAYKPPPEPPPATGSSDPQLVPAGTVCRLRIEIRRGADGPLTRSGDPKSQARYLLLAFTVTAPEQFAGARFLDRFGTQGRNGQPTGYYAEEGRRHIGRMATSAGIKLERPDDIKFEKLDGIEVVARVGIRQRSFKGVGDHENHIREILIPGDRNYQEGADDQRT